MKQLIYLFIIILSVTCLQSCQADPPVDDPDDPVVTLTASPVSFSISAAGDTCDIAITSNTIWQISGGNTWCRTNISVTSGNAPIKLFVAANDVEQIRTNTLTLSATGADNISISVTQAAKAPEPQEPVKPAYIAPDATDMRLELSAIDVSELMGIGWNLGNSLECISYNNGVYSGGETSWGNPATTRQLIDSVKKAGFNAVRIPVAWSHMVYDQISYKIKWAWKKRVEEVVNYVLDNDMYAIINIHWDGGWMNNPVYAQQTAINAKIDSLWKQIAIYFRDYDDHLLFAGTNEVYMEGNYNAPIAENIAVQNSFNQTFVNTVRSTGGRNTYRFLVVQGYVTNIEYAKNYMVMPTDPTNDRLMAEVHYYDPWEFCLKEDAPYVTVWDDATWGKEAWVNTAFGYMKTTFVDKGIPVILGEYGVIYRSSLSGQALTDHIASRNYYLNYVTGKALDYGMVPCYWDNGYENSFGLFKRTDGTRLRKDAITALITAAGGE